MILERRAINLNHSVGHGGLQSARRGSQPDVVHRARAATPRMPAPRATL